MIIDCHGHFTTVPPVLRDYRKALVADFAKGQTSDFPSPPEITDDDLREAIEKNQLRLMRERGIDVTLFSPIAGLMGHHEGNLALSRHWSRICNDLVARVCALFPESFVPVCQLPQSPGERPETCIEELERSVLEMGFVGCNLNPDPSGGNWTDPPLTDKWWYPLYEKLVELDVPAMVHVSRSCNANFHHTGAHYLNADTAAFMQMLMSDLFTDFPTLRFVIPHGGGAVPYHWGRYRGLAQDMGRPTLDKLLMNNVFFDTCVYHQPGVDLLAKVIPPKNILFGSEMIGAVRSIDPETGHYFDDTKRYVEALTGLDAASLEAIYRTNALRVYPRLVARLPKS